MTYVAGQIPFYSAIGSIDPANDLLEIVDISANATYNVTPNNLMGITSGVAVSTTMSQTIQNKTLDASNAITVKDSSLTLQNSSDTTKQAVFSLSGITTGNTRMLTVPDASGTLVLTGATQTLTAKTLTAPTINGGTIDNATITVDALSGHTSANTGTIYGVSVTSGKISGSALANSSVTPTQLNIAPQVSNNSTSATTSSASYTTTLSDSVTVSVTITIGVNGLALIILGADCFPGSSGAQVAASFSASGANTIAVSDNNAVIYGLVSSGAGSRMAASRSTLLTGLSTGSTTFTMQYKSTSGTGTWTYRSIAAIPL